MSVKHALLGLLAERPAAVAELRRRFEDATRGTWPLNIGQVYQTVRRLERDGLIEVSDDAPADADPPHYAATDAGREELAHWWADPVIRPRDDRDELVIKVALAGQVGGVDVAKLIHAQRQAALAELRAIVRDKAQTPPERVADRLLAERRIFELEAEARWLDHVETLTAPKPTTETTGHPHGEGAQ